LERIYSQNKDDVLLAERVLSWISFAGRTLTVDEMRHAIAVLNLETEETRIDDEGVLDEDLLVAVCAGMVTIDKESRVIRLVHYTAQQYFKRIRNTKFPHAQVLITQACLRYLSLDIVRNVDYYAEDRLLALVQANPLLLYAAGYWGYHTIGEPEHLLNDQILDFLTKDSRISFYILAVVYYKCPFFGREEFPVEYRLWLAANFPLKGIMKTLLQDGVDVDSTSVRGETALIAATRRGNMEAVQMLVEHGADVNYVAVWGSGNCMTALDCAALCGHVGVVELLLMKGADINYNDENGETALCKAAETGKLPVVRLLLQNGADLRSKNYDSCSPLDAALRGGNQEIVQLMLDAVGNADFGQKYATRALFKAASGGFVEAFQLMVDHCGKHGVAEEVLQSAEMVHNGTSTRLICDHCEAGILDADVHYHCDICYSGDFDLCQRCVRDGKSCFSGSHRLIMRRYRTVMS
jgi:hypothetical protein